jgi:uncharacterized phage protein (TIGR02220 family)
MKNLEIFENTEYNLKFLKERIEENYKSLDFKMVIDHQKILVKKSTYPTDYFETNLTPARLFSKDLFLKLLREARRYFNDLEQKARRRELDEKMFKLVEEKARQEHLRQSTPESYQQGLALIKKWGSKKKGVNVGH